MLVKLHFIHALLLAAFIVVVGQAQSPDGPRATPAGFFYPTGTAYERDTNYGSCGGAIYVDSRHVGSDLKAEVGDRVYAVADGVVIAKSGPAQLSGWGVGNYGIAVKHSSSRGEFIAVYGHIQTDLGVGSLVFAGSPVGTVGRYYEERTDARTGETIVTEYGSHLHFGIIGPGGALPARGWGRLPDVGCQAGTTGNFVPPMAWLNGQPIEVVTFARNTEVDDANLRSASGPRESMRLIVASRPRVVGHKSTPNPPPAMPYEVRGSCPLGPVLLTWEGKKKLSVRKDRSETADESFKLKSGDPVTVLEWQTTVTRPGEAVIIKNLAVGPQTVAPGEKIYLLDFVGGGTSSFWHHSQLLSAPLDEFIRVTAVPEASRWVRLRDRKNRLGWAREADGFSAATACR